MLIAFAAAVALAAPAAAIIGGQDDGNAHPYVGAIDIREAGAPVVGSGVLISPTVFLTAGHVTRFFDRAGLTRAKVTFDPVVSASSTWYTGTVHTNPAYDPNRADDPGDLGAVVFDSPIPGITPASLPTQGYLDQMGPKALRGQSYSTIGYGVSALVENPTGPPQPDFSSGGTRKITRTSFIALSPGWLRLQQHEGGQACYGDSGGPTLLGASNLVVGLTITDANLVSCENALSTMRVDTPAHRAFIGQYVSLP
jgi:Trypsin